MREPPVAFKLRIYTLSKSRIWNPIPVSNSSSAITYSPSGDASPACLRHRRCQFSPPKFFSSLRALACFYSRAVFICIPQQWNLCSTEHEFHFHLTGVEQMLFCTPFLSEVSLTKLTIRHKINDSLSVLI